MADGIRVEVGDVEDFDAGFLEHGAVEGGAGIGEVGQGPDKGWVVEAAMFIGVEV